MSGTTALFIMPNYSSIPMGKWSIIGEITPTYHERMVWGQGDGSGLVAVDTAIGRIGMLALGALHPLARYALMADHEEIHLAMFPGCMVGQIFAEQMEVTIRHHALELDVLWSTARPGLTTNSANN